MSSSFICPRCGAESHHPLDAFHEYCARCHDFTGEDQGLRQSAWFELRQATDQMAVARWRDAHPDSAMEVPDHGELMFWLLDQLESYQRIDRADAAMARQLGQSIERNSRLKIALQALYQWYDRDGSVGAASDVFENHRAILS